MARYYAAPNNSGFSIIPDVREGDVGFAVAHHVPDGWEEVTGVEYERRLAAARQVADDRSAEFLNQARAPQREAGQALVSLGLPPEQASVLAGVPAADLHPTT